MAGRNIEAAFGTSLTIRDETSVGRANRVFDRDPRFLTTITTEFERVIATINQTDPETIDTSLAPHFRQLATRIRASQSPLPHLGELRDNIYPESTQAVDTMFAHVQRSITDPESRWGWLNGFSRAQLVTGALAIEGYNDVVNDIPHIRESVLEGEEEKMVVLAFEEAMVLQHPDTQLNRLVDRWYDTSEGFTQDFVDFARAQKLLLHALQADPDIANRSNMAETIAYLKENPHVVIDQVRTLNSAIARLNSLAQQKSTDSTLQNVLAVGDVIAQHPLPLPLTTPNGETSFANLNALKKAMQVTNRDMASAERKKGQSLTPEEILADPDGYLGVHLDGKTPEAVFAGLLTHTVYLWARERSEYRSLGAHDLVINALCEVLGREYADSNMFHVLYHPQYGLDWYTTEWGFSEAFLTTLPPKQ